MTVSPLPEKLFATKDFVQLIRDKYLSALTITRFEKDRMEGLTPEPVQRYGNRLLYKEAQALPYVETLLQRRKLEKRRAREAREQAAAAE